MEFNIRVANIVMGAITVFVVLFSIGYVQKHNWIVQAKVFNDRYGTHYVWQDFMWAGDRIWQGVNTANFNVDVK